MVLIFVVLALINLDSFVFAIDDKHSRQTLRGIQIISVDVARLPPEIKQDGLTEDDLRADAELKLRMAGISVVSDLDFLTALYGEIASLEILANIIKYDKYVYGYVFNVEVRLSQGVYLARKPNLRTIVSTWDCAYVGTSRSLGRIRTLTRQLVDRFIKAYLSVNRK